MRIEKDLKNNIENLNSNKVETKTSFFKIQKILCTHRLQSRENFLLKSVNFATVLTFIPFALGFAEFVYKKHTPEKSNPFFQKNLPAFTSLKPKLNFETFEYISKSNFSDLDRRDVPKKDFFGKEHGFLKKNYDSTFLFGQPNFVAKIKKAEDLSAEKFNGLSCNFYTTQIGGSSNETFYKNLDELPSYVKGLLKKEINNLVPCPKKDLFGKDQFVLFSKKDHLKTKGVDAFPKKEFFGTTDVLAKPNFSKKKPKIETKNIFSLTPISAKKALPLVTESANKLNSVPTFASDTTSLKNQFYRNRFDFYKNLNQLNTELRNIFIEKNIYSLPSQKRIFWDDLAQEKLVTDFSEVEYPFLIDQILQDFNKKRISEEFAGSRTMSGYKYPDMDFLDLYRLYVQKSVFDKFVSNGFDLEKSHLGSSSKKYNFTITNVPAVLLETKKVVLKNYETNKVFYSGPALILDSQKAFDWKIHVHPEQAKFSTLSLSKKTGWSQKDFFGKGKGRQVSYFQEDSLRSWFHQYLSPYNPLMHLQENFFGLYHSPEFLINAKSPDFSDFSFPKKDFLGPSLFHWHKFVINKKVIWDLVREPLKNNLSPFYSSAHIPSEGSDDTMFSSKEAKNVFNRGINLNLSNNKESINIEQFLPVVQLQQPQFNCLTTNSNVFSSSSPLFEKILIGKLDYSHPTDCLNEKPFTIKKVPGRYKKIPSIFSKTTKSIGVSVDNWEPLTSSSWLVVSQLSFAIFIFQTLKALADNYGRELLGYLLDLVSALGVLDDSLKQEIEILMGQREKGFRIILKSRKNFTNIAGVRKLLPEIYELVWFLRNSAREFAISKTLPRGVLLTGPPGTGKTLLVQALAGEAQVPVLVLSGSSLIEPGESGALKLEMLFQEARQLAPCIVFIDEIDTLAQKRSGVVQNPMGPDELLESLTSFETSTTGSPLEFICKSQEKQKLHTQSENPLQSEPKQDQLSLLMQFLIELDGIQGRDGVVVIGATNRPEVLDPAILRPGRFDKILQVGLPGQQKRIEILKLYGQTLGYQSAITWDYLGQRTAGFTAADLATLMNESSIKAILNQSAHTIETIEHGIDRITSSQSEKYIVLKTKSNNDKNSSPKKGWSEKTRFFGKRKAPSTENPNVLSFSSKISLLRLAYYQAGKVVVSQILETHPNVLVAYLWPRRTTIRSLQITTNLQNSVFQFARLVELNERIIGSYAGKAAEFLFLETFAKTRSSSANTNKSLSKKSLFLDHQFSNVSTLGLDDLLFAQKLIYSLVEKWSFYSKKFKIQETITLLANINAREFTKNKEKIEFYNQFVETIQTPPMTQALETQTSSLFSSKEKVVPNYNAQMYYSIPWWQQEISSELEFVEKNFANWSRIYLSNPEQSDRNPEWLPPDEFYHSSSGLKNIKRAFKHLSNRKSVKKKKNKNLSSNAVPSSKKVDLTWNEVAKLTRDYPVHSLVLQGFNKTLLILNQNREILDRIVIELLYQEILRQPELDKLFTDSENSKTTKNSKSDTSLLLSTRSLESLKSKNEPSETQVLCTSFREFEKDKTFQILESGWGFESRKRLPRWIDFENLK